MNTDKFNNELTDILQYNKFVYDNEDDLWYDEHKDRTRYMLRVVVSGVYMDGSYKAIIFNGGYGNIVGEYRTSKNLKSMLRYLFIKSIITDK